MQSFLVTLLAAAAALNGVLAAPSAPREANALANPGLPNEPLSVPALEIRQHGGGGGHGGGHGGGRGGGGHNGGGGGQHGGQGGGQGGGQRGGQHGGGHRGAASADAPTTPQPSQ
ncbi:hypothetical protein SPI_01139 [Niveomyces insectorum RCEF 264]|uniref:Uncharacterized protein n=1 Tax=Niveomyces insectorum RCEF 264 TaxID=1081102 RepID=A0A167YQ43_9HYPO|nr:hypothetical protein SPI_01139 [Niveomyces insectorum RCEF 264]